MTTTIDALAEELGLKFSKPRIVMTARGEREVRNATGEPGEAFWAAWRARKDALKAQGIGVSKSDGKWQVALWTETMSTEARSEAQEASRAVDAAIEVPVPPGMELMPFQRAGVAYALSREGTLIGDEMGLGKTLQAIGVANASGARHILVVAPASILLNWRFEINRWQTLGLPVHVIRPGSVWPTSEGWYITNYDIVGRYEAAMKSRTWDLLIADEAQYLKTRTSQRTQALLGGSRRIKGSRPAKYEQVAPVQAKRRLMLTGTPIMNRPAELFPMLHALDARRWPTWSTFARRYCAAHSNGYGYDATGASNLDELNLRLRQTVMVRRLKKDVLTELPAKRRQIVELEVDDETVRAIVEHEVETYERTESAIAEASTEMEQAKAAGDDAAYKTAVAKLTAARGIAFSEMARVRHETALAKVPAVIERLADVDGKALIFAHHLDVLDALEAALSDRGVVRIDGGTKPEDRQPIVQRFQNDPSIQFFLGGIKAAGVGLTLTAASQVYFAELDWTPAAVTQAEDRAHRIGTRAAVNVYHLVLDGSLDGKMAKTLVGKQRVMDAALDAKVEEKPVPPPPPPFIPKDQWDNELKIAPRSGIAAAPAPVLTPTQVAAVHQALRVVAGYDSDRARVLNGMGFSKMDTDFGCQLAAQSSLSPRQAVAARKMVTKYKRQYSPDLFAQMYPEKNHDEAS